MHFFSRLLKPEAAGSSDIVVDRREGLMWQRNHEPATMSLDEAYAYCRSLRLGGYSDWLLPTLGQFRRLRQSEKLRAAMSPADDVFWTSSSNLETRTAAQVYTCDGRSFSKTERFYVRAVRHLGRGS